MVAVEPDSDTLPVTPAAGVLAEIVVDVGTTVEVGTVLARIDTGGGGENVTEATAAVERINEVDEIVHAVLYLESATFVTGETLHVDGGQSAGH